MCIFVISDISEHKIMLRRNLSQLISPHVEKKTKNHGFGDSLFCYVVLVTPKKVKIGKLSSNESRSSLVLPQKTPETKNAGNKQNLTSTPLKIFAHISPEVYSRREGWKED
jgi:hypothetical protein